MGAAGTPTYKPIGTGGGGTPGGANTDVQFNNSGTFGGAPQVQITTNAVGLNRLLIGLGTDPTTALAPGGLLQFVITGDENISGVPAIFAAWSLNGGFSNGATFFGLGGNGTFATPTADVDGDNLLKVAGVGFDSTNSVVVNPPAASIIFAVDGATAPGIVAGQVIIGYTDLAGNEQAALWIRNTGRIGIGDDFHDPEGRFHIRNEQANVIASIVQGFVSQTADLTDWDSRITGTLAVTANPGDTTLTLTSSVNFNPTGVVFITNNDPLYHYRPVTYTANNTGTGVLTLASPMVATAPVGTVVYQSQVLTSIDANGNVILGGGTATGARGYIQIGEFDSATPTNDAPAPADDQFRIYARDNGAGKTQAVIRFATGAVQVVATQP